MEHIMLMQQVVALQSIWVTVSLVTVLMAILRVRDPVITESGRLIQ